MENSFETEIKPKRERYIRFEKPNIIITAEIDPHTGDIFGETYWEIIEDISIEEAKTKESIKVKHIKFEFV